MKHVIYNLTIVIFVFLGLIGCANEEKNTYYATFRDAQKDSAYERGLMPEIMPQSAVNIYIRYYSDLNYVWLKFNFDVNEAPHFLAYFNVMKLKEIRMIGGEMCEPPKWWPEMLTSNSLEKAKESFPFLVAKHNYQTNYGSDKKKGMHGYFFVNTKTGDAYYFGGLVNHLKP